MKLSNFVAIAAVIGGSFLIPVPAEARNGWKQVYCDPDDGSCWHTRVISRNYPYVTYENNYPTLLSKKEADCQQYKSRHFGEYYKGGKSPWKDAMPGSIGEALLDSVCR